MSRVAAEPLAKCLIERAAVGEPQTLGKLAHGHVFLAEPGDRQLPSYAVLQALVVLPLFCQAPTQGRWRQAQLPSQAVSIGPLLRGQAQQVGADTPPEAGRVTVLDQDIARRFGQKTLQLLLAAPQGKSRYCEAMIMRVRGRSKCRFSENMTR